MEYSTDSSSLAESRSSLIAEDDLVAVRAQFSGRRVGALDGFAVIGQACSVQHIPIYRTTDGRISEHWRAAMTAAPPARWASSPTPTTRQHDARQTAQNRAPTTSRILSATRTPVMRATGCFPVDRITPSDPQPGAIQ